MLALHSFLAMGNPFSIENKKILVTGATSGIGLSICEAINEMNGSFIGIGRNLKLLEQTIPGHQKISFDLTQLDKINDLVDQIEPIDGFVHSAGIVEMNLIKFFKPELYEHMRKTNLDSFLYLMSALLKKKKIKKGASIVLISSLSGLFGVKGNALYGMTKAGLNVAAKTYASELAGQKIRINTVAPGMVKTQITEDFIATLGKEQMEIDEGKYPLGYGDPNDVAYPVIFLLSDAAKWITGEVIVLDGGRTATI